MIQDLTMRFMLSAALALGFTAATLSARPPALGPADLIVRNAKVVTVDARFSVAGAVAATKGQIVAVGTDAEVMALKGPDTRVIDAAGKMVLPGLYDSHTHPVGAAESEAGAPLPLLKSIVEVVSGRVG